MSTLKLTDAVLFDRSLPFDARAVLALTLGHQGKNPSVDYTAAAIGLQPRTVLTAQRVLEYGTRVWTMDDAGAIALVADCPATATFDRPSEWYERHPNSPQFHRSTKLDVLAPWAKPADHAHAELPADIAARLPKREHHNSIVRLVALAYAREQLIRGAIQIEDASLAYLLGASPRQVRRAREQLLREGILRFERREGPCDIYTMPGGTPVRPIDPDALEPLWTRRLATLTIGPFLLNLYASPSELDTAARLVDKIGEPKSIAALVTAFPTVEEHLHGREVLAALELEA